VRLGFVGSGRLIAGTAEPSAFLDLNRSWHQSMLSLCIHKVMAT